VLMNLANGNMANKLQEWQQEEGELPNVFQFYRELWQIQTEAKSRIHITKPPLIAKEMHERLCNGTPLLPIEEFSPDWNEVSAFFELVTAWLSKDSEADEEIKNLRNISSDRATLKEIAKTWYQGRSLAEMATTLHLGDEVLVSIIAATLKPFLQVYSSLLLPEVKQDLWRRGYCPVCGGLPDFSYLEKDSNARWLLCSRCDAEWLFLRLECPYCGTHDQRALSYFTDKEETYPYRVYVCDQCHKYIKAVDMRRAKPDVLLPLERLITLELDAQICEKGYTPGWGVSKQ
jgi:FdhE protein